MIFRINYQKTIGVIILTAIFLRILLLFINPISMWADPLFRFIPDSYKILSGNLTFYTPPLLSLLNAMPLLFFTGRLLEFSWKFIPFLFFLFSLLIFIKILRVIELKKTSKLFLLSLFLFNVYSLLTSTTVMQESLVLFFTLCLFYILETYKNLNAKVICLLIVLSGLLLYSKETGLFILAGFFIYILLSNRDNREKIILILALILGVLLYLPWIIKNYIIYDALLGGNSEYASVFNDSSFLDFNITLDYLIGILEYSYRIPQLSDLDYSGILYLFSRIYYFCFAGMALLFTICVFGGIIRYSRQYKRYIYLIIPILSVVIWLAFFSPFHYVHDFGRYMFPFYFIYFFFGLKFIENLKSEQIKKAMYCILAGIIIFSIITSFFMALNFNSKDKEIRKAGQFISGLDGEFTSNDQFSAVALSYYSKKEVKFLLSEDITDKSVYCKNPIYASDMYFISSISRGYNICINN